MIIAQLNRVFALLISMQHFKSIHFDHNRPKIKLFLQKRYKIFVRWVLRSQIPKTASSLHTFGHASKSNHVFALLISMSPEFSLMPHFRNINFYQSKSNIKPIYQKINKNFKCWGLPPEPQWPRADWPEPLDPQT